jgi:hypothetical protein
MALITSAASGNFSAGATWTGGVVPTVGDEARASTGHTVTIDVNTTCDEVSNAGTGIFTLASGVTLTANVTNKSTTVTRNCLQFTAASPAVGYIIGNCTGGTVSTAHGANNTGSGTLNVTGNSVASSGSFSVGVNNSGTGTTNITGNATGGSGANAHGAYITTGTMSITGNVTGGSGTTAFGVRLEGAGTLTVTGNATGGSVGGGISNLAAGIANVIGNVTGSTGANSFGANNESTGTLTITGIATAGTTNGAAGARNSSTGTINLTRAKGNAYGPGNTSGLLAGVGAANVGLGVIQIEELEYGDYGMSPTSGTGIRLKKLSSNVAVFNYVDAGAAKTLVDATQGQMPAASDVRDGVSYASGALTGSCKVPAAASVGFGVPVDATTGTAALTPASVWDHLLTAITTSSTIGTLLKTNIDATISSRSTATTAGIADAVWDEVLTGATHNVNRSAGKRLRQIADERIIADGQTVSATTNTITLEPIGTLCVGQTIVVTDQDTNDKQARFILAFDTGTDTATVDSNWCVVPTAGDEYLLTTVRDPLVTRGDHPTGTVGAEIDEMYLIHGLKDGEVLTVTPTSRTAGAISQTIGGDGTNTTTVSRD